MSHFKVSGMSVAKVELRSLQEIIRCCDTIAWFELELTGDDEKLCFK